MSQAIIQGLGIFTVFIGFKMAAETRNVLSTVCHSDRHRHRNGADIEGRLERIAVGIERRFAKGGSGLANGFLAASLLLCRAHEHHRLYRGRDYPAIIGS